MALQIVYEEKLKYCVSDPEKCAKYNQDYFKEITCELYPNAYMRVERTEWNKKENSVSFFVAIYADNSITVKIGNRSYTFMPSITEDSTNEVQQAYEHLKTLPEFENAIDC
jgi:hypothetical protein